MERREFLTVAGGALVMGRTVGPWEGQTVGVHGPTVRPQTPQLGPEIYARRLERLQQELKTRQLDLLVVEPSTNFQYFTGYNPGRSERLILLMVPATGAPVLICPSFEVERIKRNSVISDVRGWEEQEDPWRLVRTAGTQLKPVPPSPRREAVAAVEPTTSYQSYLNLAAALGGGGAAGGA